MPNFRCKTIKKISLPFEKEGVEFLWLAENRNIQLIFTKCEGENFFLQIKKADVFIVKAEKHSKPIKIGVLQKSLLVFKENFCEDIITESLKFKNTHLVKNTSLIAYTLKEFLEQIQDKRKIYIEIGFGSGRHLLYQARSCKDCFIIGIEVYTPALEQVAKIALKEKINNILLFKEDARLLFSILNSNSIEKIFLHFPIPWDKKPHRRVISKEFAEEILRVLKVKGQFELRTDSREYFDFSLQTFLEFEKIKIALLKNNDLDVSSKYEDRWKKLEKNIYDLVVFNKLKNKKIKMLQDFDFGDFSLPQEKLEEIIRSLQNKNFKGKDFFIHFKNFYKVDTRFMLKVILGAFHKPEHVYLFLDKKINFIFEKPSSTRENIKALEKVKEILINI